MRLVDNYNRKVLCRGINLWVVSREYVNPDDNYHRFFLSEEEARKQYDNSLPDIDDMLESEKQRCELFGIDEEDAVYGIHDIDYYKKHNCFHYYCADGYGCPQLYFILSMKEVEMKPCDSVI